MSDEKQPAETPTILSLLELEHKAWARIQRLADRIRENIDRLNRDQDDWKPHKPR